MATVINAYDDLYTLSIDEVLLWIEARVKELVATDEEDATLVTQLVDLLGKALNEVQVSSTSSSGKKRPELSADARAAAMALSEVLAKHTKATDRRLRLEQDKAVLPDFGIRH